MIQSHPSMQGKTNPVHTVYSCIKILYTHSMPWILPIRWQFPGSYLSILEEGSKETLCSCKRTRTAFLFFWKWLTSCQRLTIHHHHSRSVKVVSWMLQLLDARGASKGWFNLDRKICSHFLFSITEKQRQLLVRLLEKNDVNSFQGFIRESY